jgi:CRISPR/Cas system-associated endoribonuclease Cas2
MSEQRNWLVTFDVVGDGARRLLSRRLERFGPRVAYSVFTVHSSAERLDRLLSDSADLVGRDGHLLAVPYCGDCEVFVYGLDLGELPNPGWLAT